MAKGKKKRGKQCGLRRLLGRCVLALGLLFILLAIVPMLIPMDAYRQAAEKAASEALGLPVTMADMRLRLLPFPGVSLKGLTVGDVQRGERRLAARAARTTFAILPLLSGQLQLTSLRLDDVVVRLSNQQQGLRRLHLDRLSGTVEISAERLRITRGTSRLYGGSANFTATIFPLQGSRRRIGGELQLSGIKALPLLRDTAATEHLSGSLASEISFAMQGGEPESLRQSLRVDGPVHLTEGAIHGIGLKGAATLLIPGGKPSGDIAYNRLDFRLHMRGNSIAADDIRFGNEALNATGDIQVGADGRLQGKIMVQGSGIAQLAGSTFVVGGSVEKPLILPDTITVLGGTVGAVVGGPVGAAVGASIGSKAGDVVDSISEGIKGLFQGK